MSLRFDFDIKEIDKKLDAWARQFRQKKKIHTYLAKKEYERSIRRFQTKRDPDGHPWAPWAESTLEQRTRKGNAALGILVDTTALRQSVQVGITRNSFIIGTNNSYSEYHNEGEGDLPQRAFLGFNEQIMTDMEFLIDSMLATNK